MIFKDYREFSKIEINEGLITTYPMDYLVKKITRLLGMGMKIKFHKHIDKLFNTLSVSFRTADIEVLNLLSDYGTSCGYFISAILVNDKWLSNIKQVKLEKESLIEVVFESKFDEEVESIPNKLYHVTPYDYVDKILKKGLIPKSKSKLSFHIDRIYLAINIKAAKSIINEFKIHDTFNKKSRNYSILEIDTDNLHVKFMKDPNATLPDGEILGIYTHENIHSKFIKLYEDKKL